MYSTYPSKKSPVNPEQQRGQTGPGLKTQAEGLVSKSPGNGKSGNGFKLSDTSDNQPGQRTYPKKGARQTKAGDDIGFGVDVPGDIQKHDSPNWDLMSKPKAQ